MLSFGVEFEFDMLRKERNGPYLVKTASPNRYSRIKGWGYQFDLSAGSEISSPVYTDVNKFLQDCNVQWYSWVKANRDSNIMYVPFFVASSRLLHRSGHDSTGSHIHIGRPERPLTMEEKEKIARVVAQVYPFLIGLSVNDNREGYRSKRIERGRFCKPLFEYKMPISSHHFYEISSNPIGTVEFRAFDPNIPQVIATIALLLKKISEKVLGNEEKKLINYVEYEEDRRLVTKSGLEELDIDKYLRRIIDYGVDIDFSKYPNCIREVLYLAIVQRYSVGALLYDIKKSLANKGYAFYFWAMYYSITKCEDLFDNFLKVKGIPEEWREKLDEWRHESEKFQRLSDFLGKTGYRFQQGRRYNWGMVFKYIVESIREGRSEKEIVQTLVNGGFKESVAKQINKWVSIGLSIGENDVKNFIENMSRFTNQTAPQLFLEMYRQDIAYVRYAMEHKRERNRVKKLIESGDYIVCRIHEHPSLSKQNVAEQISQILGGAFLNTMTPREVIEADERFYVFCTKTRVIGCIAIRMSKGTISHLVVKPEYRKLGIGKILVNKVIEVAREKGVKRLQTYIRRENKVSKKLFRKMGFEKVGELGRSDIYGFFHFLY